MKTLMILSILAFAALSEFTYSAYPVGSKVVVEYTNGDDPIVSIDYRVNGTLQRHPMIPSIVGNTDGIDSDNDDFIEVELVHQSGAITETGVAMN